MNVTKINDFIEAIPVDLINIIRKIEYYGMDIRIVGGAVRDLLMNEEPRDIDLATDATPDELIFILNKLYDDMEFKNIDTGGIEHGTIKVLTKDNNLYEITSLAFHIRERGASIKTVQHRDWKIDALRRDFTINAMSMTMDGVIYDYLNGLNDLVNQRVKFVGFYKLKMLIDPIIILRFAKILTKFPNPEYNPSIIDFISSHAKLIDTIKPETLKWFRQEIKNSDNPDSATPALKALKLAPKIH